MSKKLISTHNDIFDNDMIQRASRDGTEIEKGVVLTKDYLIQHEQEISNLMEFYTAYPDLYLDTIKPSDSNFELFFYQRIVLRAIMRFKEVYITACRAFSKSFITILALILQCIFIPGTKRFICAPNKNQSAQIAKEKIYEIYERWPLLRKEVIGGDISDTPGNFGKDYVTLKFRNGSQFDVVGALDSQRGGRRNGGLVDEIRDHDEGPLNEVVLPLMNVSRRLPDNTVNEHEPNQQTICMTSAGVKTSFAYDKLIDMFENAIIDPNSAFVFGCDYRVPVMHGLLDKTYINKLKMSPSYKEESFAREYMSIWSGSSDESWFNFDKLQKYRKIKNPELHAINRNNPNEFYLLSVDVGRISDQTVVSVFRVNIIKEKYFATLVNIIVLGRTAATKPFSIQAIDLKKIIRDYRPREVVIDTNGLTKTSSFKTLLIAGKSKLQYVA